MKKQVLIFCVFSILVLASSCVLAANVTSVDKVTKAYSCLREKIDNKTCKELSSPELIFSVLATGKCKSELIKNSENDKCWPEDSCDLTSTAQAVLALSSSGTNVDEAKEWLMDQKQIPKDLIWYLEIENEGQTTCKISYNNRNYEISISEDKIISGPAGTCLTLVNSQYWLTVSPSCYDEEFEISCDKDFLTTFLFQQKNSPTIHVIDEVHSAPASGKTVEKINSFCFAKKGNCDYEGSLWAAAVLDKLGEDVKPFMPYLITMAEGNKNVFPYPLLYSLTNKLEYKTKVLDYQIDRSYWKQTNKDKYYDTALALLPFKGEELTEKTNTIDWLFKIQQDDGCWDNGNIRNNAFLLYSIWPIKISDSDDDTLVFDNDCELSKYFCMSGASCQGNILYNYQCSGLQVCCDQNLEEQTCADLNGEICSSNQYCQRGEKVSAAGLGSYETCCIGGACASIEGGTGTNESITEENDCELNYGICETGTCGTGYKESTDYVCSGQDTCCIKEAKTSSAKKYLWIWILLFLIVLAVVGIVYKDKIKEFFEKKKKPVVKKGPEFPSYPREPMTFPQRKIIPKEPVRGQPLRPVANRPRPKSPKELEEVLKKLKEMSK